MKEASNWRIIQLSSDATTAFAVDELSRYIRKIGSNEVVSIAVAEGMTGYPSHGIRVGVGNPSEVPLPPVSDRMLDDAIFIDVKERNGIIAGTNPRAVLIAVYRYLREIGCMFIHPGTDGEIMPHENALKRDVCICEKPSYRHRGICIEGTNSYQHIADMIDWMPKAGLNGYFTQFLSGYGFMRHWYEQKGEPFTEADAISMTKRYELEINKRSLMYHAVGHGWTCEPFGISVSQWKTGTDEISEDYRRYIAVWQGERQLFFWTPGTGTPGNTNLCYSNPEVRERMTDAILDYCRNHSNVDYLHFWLADGMDNHCECPECSAMRPSDWYVTMLNLLDRKLESERINTKIVFLVYVDLMWAPEKNRIVNKDRFTLMFAPITRVFSSSFSLEKGTDISGISLPEYTRNKLKFPISIEDNLTHLKKWQAGFSGDSFDYDYHAVGAHFHDPGLHEISRVMNEDMKALEVIGLNGMMSCQLQRVFFPTGILMETMAQTLWDRNTDFDTLCGKYYTSVYGGDGLLLRDYLKEISFLYDIGFIRNDRPDPDIKKHKEKLKRIPELVRSFKPVISRNIENTGNSHDTVRNRLWKHLSMHGDITVKLSGIVSLGLDGKKEELEKQVQCFNSYVRISEAETHQVLDCDRLIKSVADLVSKRIPKITREQK